MSLIRRTRSVADWPDIMGRPLFEWPEPWKEMFDADLKIEEYRDGDTVVVRAELPGVDPDDGIDVAVDDHMLHLRAERRSESKTEEANGYRSEFRYGSFSRTVPLPTGAREADVTATYVDGILEIKIPVDADEASAKKVPIARA
jgi:HSP20 family protein